MKWYKQSKVKPLNKEYVEHIPGGRAEGKQPEDYPADQISQGINVELEHTEDKNIAQEISLDHLEEFDDYYTGLAEMETKLKKEHKKKASVVDVNDPDKLARQMNVKYNGPQLDQGKLYGHLFTDNLTGDSFLVRLGQDFQQKLNATRNRMKNKN